jgi:transcriptional regulator with XRE-family HTH domain
MRGNVIKEIRKASKLSQEQVAQYLGIDQTTLAKIENGTRNLNTTLVEKLNNLFGCGELNFSKPKEITKEDLEAIADVNKIVLNIIFMNEIEEKENESKSNYGSS